MGFGIEYLIIVQNIMCACVLLISNESCRYWLVLLVFVEKNYHFLSTIYVSPGDWLSIRAYPGNKA